MLHVWHTGPSPTTNRALPTLAVLQTLDGYGQRDTRLFQLLLLVLGVAAVTASMQRSAGLWHPEGN
jgi:hypothetical protein